MYKKDVNDIVKQVTESKSTFTSTWEFLFGDPADINRLKEYLKSLPDDDKPLSQAVIDAIKKIVEKSSKDKTVEKVFIQIRQLIAREKKQKEEKYLVIPTWWFEAVVRNISLSLESTYSYDRAQSVVDAIDEHRSLKWSLQQKKSLAKGLAILYCAVMYGFVSKEYIAFFAARLGLHVGGHFVSNRLIPSSNPATKQYMAWFIGLGTQVICDYFGGGGVFSCCYVAGTALEFLSRQLFNQALTLAPMQQRKKTHPFSINLLQKVLEDTGFFIGSLAIQKVLTTAAQSAEETFDYSPAESSELKFIDSRCTPPPGSFGNTCRVISSSPIVDQQGEHSFILCLYKVICKQADHKTETMTTFALSVTMMPCLNYMENCDGKLVFRNKNTRLCTTENAAREIAANAASELQQSCEALQQTGGSYTETCSDLEMKTPHFSASTRAWGLSESSYCEFKIGCKDLDGQQKVHRQLLPKFIRGCFGFFENCHGELIPRTQTTDRQCMGNPEVARAQAQIQNTKNQKLLKQFSAKF